MEYVAFERYEWMSCYQVSIQDVAIRWSNLLMSNFQYSFYVAHGLIDVGFFFNSTSVYERKRLGKKADNSLKCYKSKSRANSMCLELYKTLHVFEKHPVRGMAKGRPCQMPSQLWNDSTFRTEKAAHSIIVQKSLVHRDGSLFNQYTRTQNMNLE